MAHYAYIDDENRVIAVTVGRDENEIIDGLDPETYYARGTNYTVKRTSYNGKIRKQFAGIGFFYDPIADVFIAPQPYPSWLLNDNYDWQAPISYPTDGLIYVWNEQAQDWEAYVETNA